MEAGYTIPIHEHGYVRYIEHMGSDERIVEAARISYRSPSKGKEQDRKLLRYLFANKHTSPFEMCKITLNVKLPIFVMRQWVRHRMQNLNEVSARYTQLPDDHYIPRPFRAQDTVNKQGSVVSNSIDQDRATSVLSSLYRQSYQAYETLLELGVAKEQARLATTVGIYTEIYSCWDLNNLLKFFALRDDSHAQAEIQDYARAMKQIAAKCFPTVMEIYEDALSDREIQKQMIAGYDELTQRLDVARELTQCPDGVDFFEHLQTVINPPQELGFANEDKEEEKT